MEGKPDAGETVVIVSQRGEFLAHAAYSPSSQIVARAWSFQPAAEIHSAFLEARLRAAIDRRKDLWLSGITNACRLVHAESDALPGLIVDRYGDTLVVQVLSAGAEYWRETWIKTLAKLTGCERIYERSDLDVRELEGLAPRKGPLLGAAPEALIEIQEYGIRYQVDVAMGQKTGFYLDQRVNRARVGQLAAGRRVLNAFCYSGGFSLSAMQHNARSVVSIDSSGEALALARANLATNGYDAEHAHWIEGDVFHVLRDLRQRAERFDLIILDPPKFAPTPGAVEKAARGYKDINLLALKLLAPQGLLATFSCSGGVSIDLFQKIVAGAAIDAQAEAQIIARLGADTDHPVSIHFPEGEYLKGLILQRTN